MTHVSIYYDTRLWVASFQKEHLGVFAEDEEEAAARAYDDAARRRRGAGAHGGQNLGRTWRLNFPTDEEVAAADGLAGTAAGMAISGTTAAGSGGGGGAGAGVSAAAAAKLAPVGGYAGAGVGAGAGTGVGNEKRPPRAHNKRSKNVDSAPPARPPAPPPPPAAATHRRLAATDDGVSSTSTTISADILDLSAPTVGKRLQVT